MDAAVCLVIEGPSSAEAGSLVDLDRPFVERCNGETESGGVEVLSCEREAGKKARSP